MTHPELAAKILELLGPDGENWTKDVLARDKMGSPVKPESEDAVCWCVSGAAIKTIGWTESLTPFALALMGDHYNSIPGFNDSAESYDVVRGKLQALAAKGDA